MARGRGESLSEKLKILADIQLRDWSSRTRQFPYDPDELLGMAGTYDRRIKAIEESREYNNIGKDNRKNEVVIETYGQVSKWGEKMLSGLDGRIDSLRTSIRSVTMPPNPKDSSEAILFELRQQEIRKAFSATDALEAEILFLNSPPAVRDALISGPPVVRRSPDGVPMAEPFVRSEVVDRVLMGEAEAAAGSEKVDELRELELLRGKFESLLVMFRAELKKQTSVILSEPVEAMKG